MAGKLLLKALAYVMQTVQEVDKYIANGEEGRVLPWFVIISLQFEKSPFLCFAFVDGIHPSPPPEMCACGGVRT